MSDEKKFLLYIAVLINIQIEDESGRQLSMHGGGRRCEIYCKRCHKGLRVGSLSGRALV
jgi:hypothetical protein